MAKPSHSSEFISGACLLSDPLPLFTVFLSFFQRPYCESWYSFFSLMPEVWSVNILTIMVKRDWFRSFCGSLCVFVFVYICFLLLVFCCLFGTHKCLALWLPP